MSTFIEYLAQGNAWLFIPGAIVLGALHGLEPGHSKTMMTAFIVAIRGTVWQAFLLGISATISHTAVIWILAFIGLRYSSALDMEKLEPYFQVATGIIVVGLAVWMLYRIRTAERHHHHGEDAGLEFEDAHERAHALEIKKQLENSQMTTGQIIVFGLTGGLLPCPSAFAVLLVCLQLKQFTLGFAMVLAFSIGLAVTLVSVGVIAALSVKHASRRFKGFAEFAAKMPYVSSILLIVIGSFVAVQGLRHIL